MTQSIPNASPHRFDYKWEGASTLVVTYKSKRNMIDIYAGLVEGVGVSFRETLEVRKLSASRIKILFG